MGGAIDQIRSTWEVSWVDQREDPAAGRDDPGEGDDDQHWSHALMLRRNECMTRRSRVLAQVAASSVTGPASFRTVSMVSASAAVLSSR